MSDNAPPEQPGYQSDPVHDTIRFDSEAAGAPPGTPGPGWPSPAQPPRRRGPLLALAIGTAMALIVGGGAYAFYQIDPLHLFRAGPQAAEAVPSNALAYASIDLDPAATQKIDALRFLEHFPAFKSATDITDERDDIRRTILEDAIDALDCDGVSYDDSIEPWLGSKFAFAAMPSDAGSDPEPLIAVEVTDRDAADAGLKAVLSCAKDAGGGPDDVFGWAFTGDYVLLAQSSDLAGEFADAAERSSLADDSDFKADMASLGELGVATAWVDIGRLLDTFPDDVFGPGVLDPTAGGDDTPLNLLEAQYQRAAATFRFASDHVDVVTSIRGNPPSSDHPDNEIVDLPESTVLAMSVAGGGDALAASWDDAMKAARALDDHVDDELGDFEDETGLKVPEDLETLLGDNLLFAVDSDGLSAATINSGDPGEINAGVRFAGDKAALDDLYGRVMRLLHDSVGGPLALSKHDFDRGFAIATNDDYAGKLAELGGSLGDSQNFQSVIDDGAGKRFVLFFNWDLLEDEILAATPPGAGSVAENIRPLRALGITSDVDGEYVVSDFVVSVD